MMRHWISRCVGGLVTSVTLACSDGGLGPADRIAVCDEVPRWVGIEPAVLDPNSIGDAMLTAVFSSCVPNVDLSRPAGPTFLFTAVDDTTAEATVPAQELLASHDPSDTHTFAGFLNFSNSAGPYLQASAFLNVRLGTIPDVAVTPLALDAQRTRHIVNLQLEEPFTSSIGIEAIFQRFYQLMGDDYEFAALVNDVIVFENRSFEHVRNHTDGVGLSPMDRGAEFGSPATLEGVILFPIGPLFDLASPAASHEIGHRWINFSGVSALALGAPHWPLSDLADGIMGFSISAAGVGGSTPGPLVPAGGASLRVDCSQPRDLVFKDLELYLMGLVPSQEVAPHVVFDNQSQTTACGAIWGGGTTSVSIEDVIDANGPRLPAFGEAPTTFRIATVVVSAGHLLTPAELAFYDFMAARGSATIPLPFSSGGASGISNPFFVATGGRATLQTELQ